MSNYEQSKRRLQYRRAPVIGSTGAGQIEKAYDVYVRGETEPYARVARIGDGWYAWYHANGMPVEHTFSPHTRFERRSDVGHNLWMDYLNGKYGSRVAHEVVSEVGGGTSGQDRESYTDDQDRDSYTVS